MQIDVDFQVWKELTLLRSDERVSYNDVLRALLGLPPQQDNVPGSQASQRQGGFTSRGLFLPNGTELRGLYKRKLYRAVIRDGAWLDANGQSHDSPSAAAGHITQTSVNGLRFWEAKRPGDTDFRRLDFIAANIR